MTATRSKTDAAGAGRTIRRAAADDVETLHAMLAAMSRELGCADAFRCDVEALRQHGFGLAPLFRAVIAERGREALGMALYLPEFSTLFGRPGVYVQDLYIGPGARGTGLGRRLLGAAARDGSQAWSAAYLRLCAHETNAGALAFYRRLGFETDPGDRLLWIEGTAFSALGGIA